jgi:hypothetical protein
VVSHDAVPDLTDQVLRADQAVKAELFTADRRLIIAGCSYYWPEAYSVAVLPRLYGAAFLSFGLATMDGLEGKNRCELHIWPVSEKPKPEVLVRWQPEYGAAMSANGHTAWTQRGHCNVLPLE